jgi:chaperone BCS1
MLRGFKEGKLFGAHLPIDNKLGFLLYGPPGTGKTGLIAAVANYLGRDVVNIDTSRIKTRKALDAALEMDCRRNIFVFEEFDTMPGVGRREAAEGDGDGDGGQRSGAVTPGEGRDGGSGGGPDMAQMALMMMAGGGAKKDGGGSDFMEELREERKAAADKLDLGYLLRKLDGLESGNGRIIIATTNHPERIDPALLRPGRFGLQIHLTRCTRPMLQEMVHMIYQVERETPASEAIVDALEKVPELKWAPAELLQLGVTLPTAEEMVRHLAEQEPACFR